MIISLFVAPIEYILAFYVFKKGRTLSKYIVAVLFFLASYQLGELIAYLFDDYSKAGVQLAYFSTTLLPPLGILLLERVSGKNFGYVVIQTVGLVFAIMFLIDPSIIQSYQVDEFFIKVDVTEQLFWYWAYPYYLGVLVYSLVISAVLAFINKNSEVRKFMRIYFVAIGSFFFSTFAIVLVEPDYTQYFASLMCALAFGAAFIMTWASFYLDEEKMNLAPASFKNHIPFVR